MPIFIPGEIPLNCWADCDAAFFEGPTAKGELVELAFVLGASCEDRAAAEAFTAELEAPDVLVTLSETLRLLSLASRSLSIWDQRLTTCLSDSFQPSHIASAKTVELFKRGVNLCGMLPF